MELIGRGVSRSFWFHLEAYGAGAPLFRFRRERRKRASPAKTVGFPREVAVKETSAALRE